MPAKKTMHVFDCKVSQLFVDEKSNNRREIKVEDCISLAASIKKQGLLIPIIVRKSKKPGYDYHLVAGFRRYVAVTKILKWESIPASLIESKEDVEVNLTENIERQQLSIYEESEAVDRLLSEGYSTRDIEFKLSRSNAWIEYRMRFSALPDALKKLVAFEKVSIKDAETIAKMCPSKQISEARKILEEIKKRKKGLVPDYLARRTRSKPEARLFSYLLGRDDQDKFKQANAVLRWLHGELSVFDMFKHLGLTEKDADEFLNYKIPA